MTGLFIILLSLLAPTAGGNAFLVKEQERPISVKTLGDGTVQADFGRVAFGQLDIRLSSKTGSDTVVLHLGERAAYFRCSDDTLNRIWELCRYSMKATSFTGYYVDGDRERIPYEADALINQLGRYGFGMRPLRVNGWYTFTPGGYRDVKADRSLFFFDSYPEENTTLKEEFFATQTGTYTAPVVTVESLYAPHYRANGPFAGELTVE